MRTGLWPSSDIMMLPSSKTSVIKKEKRSKNPPGEHGNLSRTRFYIPVRVSSEFALAYSLLRLRHLSRHQRQVLFSGFLFCSLRDHLPPLPLLAFTRSHCGISVRVRRFLSHHSRFAFCTPGLSSKSPGHPVLMHPFQRPGYAQHQLDKPPFWKLGVIDQIRIDRILQVSSPVVWQQDVHRFATAATRVADA